MHEDSDVDVLVLVDDASWEGKRRVYEAFDEAASELGLEDLSPWFSVHIHTPAWLAGRRAIRSAADYDAWLAPADEARRVIALPESFLAAVRSAVAAQD